MGAEHPISLAISKRAARARGRTGGQKAKLTPRQAKIAQAMYDEVGADGRRQHTVQQIAEEFVSRVPRSIGTYSARRVDLDRVDEPRPQGRHARRPSLSETLQRP
jgi:hypothetical protein